MDGVTALLNDLQGWLAQGVAALPLAYPLAAGILAALNPCGFLMLPSLAAFTLARPAEPGGAEVGPLARGVGALALAGQVTVGFIGLFVAVGLLVAWGGRWAVALFPWGGVAVGVGLAGLGLWLLLSGRPLVLAPATRVQAAPGRSPGALVAFGVAYGVASLGCTLPVFLAVVGSALATEGLLPAAVRFLNYALGMGLVVAAVALGTAYAEGALARLARRVLPWAERLGAGFLVVAGVYLALYWAPYAGLSVD